MKIINIYLNSQSKYPERPVGSSRGYPWLMAPESRQLAFRPMVKMSNSRHSGESRNDGCLHIHATSL
jgi:hypothetical protein